MKTVFASKHYLHNPKWELDCGEKVECAEIPLRAEKIHQALSQAKLGSIIEPKIFSTDLFRAVHTSEYISFLQTAWKDWAEEHHSGDVFGTNFNTAFLCSAPPVTITGKAGYYLSDTSVSITKNTWEAIEQSAFAALTALEIVANGENEAFALCRPPGHHASANLGGGYCLLNNAAITAQAFIDKEKGRVAILDIDYHHGNGTQDIFYKRNDVLYNSIHADPDFDFPYFQGRASETGIERGEGYNKNYPMPLGTDWASFKDALESSVSEVKNYDPDLLIVSLGVDTFIDDPISKFKILSEDYLRMGKAIAKINKPTLFIMEGGYNTSSIGLNVTNVLKGFLSR